MLTGNSTNGSQVRLSLIEDGKAKVAVGNAQPLFWSGTGSLSNTGTVAVAKGAVFATLLPSNTKSKSPIVANGTVHC